MNAKPKVALGGGQNHRMSPGFNAKHVKQEANSCLNIDFNRPPQSPEDPMVLEDPRQRLEEMDIQILNEKNVKAQEVYEDEDDYEEFNDEGHEKMEMEEPSTRLKEISNQ